MKMWKLTAGAVFAMALGASQAQAQAIGVQGSWGSDSDLGVGARLEYNLPNLISSTGPLANTFLIGSFDYFFMDCPEGLDCGWMEGNLNLAVPVGTSSLRPYAGAGLNVAVVKVSVDGFDASESATEVGLNVLGGLRFNLGGLSTYGEGRFELGGGEQFVLTFGVLLGGSR